MIDWIEHLQSLRGEFDEFIEVMLVTIASVRGSAPREVGARMIVTPTQTIGTIGGGQLEYQCSRIAFEHLRDYPVPKAFWRRFPLGSDLGQCCGGVVEVLFERFVRSDCRWFDELQHFYQASEPLVMATSSDNKYLISADNTYSLNDSELSDEVLSVARAMLGERHGSARSIEHAEQQYLLEPFTETDMQVAIFGAGHVGSAVVAALSKIDCRIRWIDNRRNIFPASLPPRVTRVDSPDPAREVHAMPPGAFFLVMTHSHPLDYDICQQVLERNDFAYCGLIGSVTKRRRFEKLMRDCEMPASSLERLSCPIGIGGISGKRPDEIAISVAAELLTIRDALRVDQGYDHGQPLTIVAKSGRP
ncbi:MAG: xanthine dehydrogenase accessory protein XdhC [Gammaproteobacteria bacterium]|nr:xanthine dehydrogenase accessory protein XdhC [Gammaproteobacteria bacterium]